MKRTECSLTLILIIHLQLILEEKRLGPTEQVDILRKHSPKPGVLKVAPSTKRKAWSRHTRKTVGSKRSQSARACFFFKAQANSKDL